jgi:hypothetical protein
VTPRAFKELRAARAYPHTPTSPVCVAPPPATTQFATKSQESLQKVTAEKDRLASDLKVRATRHKPLLVVGMKHPCRTPRSCTLEAPLHLRASHLYLTIEPAVLNRLMGMYVC